MLARKLRRRASGGKGRPLNLRCPFAGCPVAQRVCLRCGQCPGAVPRFPSAAGPARPACWLHAHVRLLSPPLVRSGDHPGPHGRHDGEPHLLHLPGPDLQEGPQEHALLPGERRAGLGRPADVWARGGGAPRGLLPARCVPGHGAVSACGCPERQHLRLQSFPGPRVGAAPAHSSERQALNQLFPRRVSCVLHAPRPLASPALPSCWGLCLRESLSSRADTGSP